MPRVGPAHKDRSGRTKAVHGARPCRTAASAAVGVIANLDTLVLFWAAFTAAIIFGTSAVLVVTALSAQALLRPAEERPA